MTLDFLLDTSIISAPIAKEPNRQVVRRLRQHASRCAVAAPVWHELVYGCSRLPPGKRRMALEEYLHAVVLSSFPVLPYDEIAAACHGRERVRLEERGRTPPFVDGQIASIAQTQNLTLITANMRDFEWFDGVKTADWTR